MKLQLVEGRQIDMHTYIHSLQVTITTLNKDHEVIEPYIKISPELDLIVSSFSSTGRRIHSW